MYIQLTPKMVDFKVYLADKTQLHNRSLGGGGLGELREPLPQPRMTLYELLLNSAGGN